jgi:nucleotide-binding universal stress UspA family protein
VKKILYATDISESARHAFAYAVSLANLYGASITLLHVLAESSDLMDHWVVGYIGSERWEEIKNQHFQEATETLTRKKREYIPIKEVLDQFCEKTKASHEDHDFDADEILVLRGNPVETILEQAEKKNCDLIVMGTHGHGKLADVVLGSTARRVVGQCKKPVLVIRLPEENE